MGYVYLIGVNDKPFLGRPPYYRFVPECEVWEYAHRICLRKPFRSDLTSYSIEPVRVAVTRIGKCVRMVQLENHCRESSLYSDWQVRLNPSVSAVITAVNPL